MPQHDCQAYCCCCQAENENTAGSWCQQPKVLHAVLAGWSGLQPPFHGCAVGMTGLRKVDRQKYYHFAYECRLG